MTKIYKDKEGYRVQLAHDAKVSFFQAGGGMAMSLPVHKFIEQFTLETETPGYTLVAVGIDGDFMANAYCNSDRWNGWACPAFPIAEARKLMDRLMAMSISVGSKISMDGKTWTIDYDGENEDFWEVETLNGEEVVWIGSSSWCWDILGDPQ